MIKYGSKELALLNIQVGCVLKLARLEKGISQETLGISLFSDKTKIARLERYEHSTSWDTIYSVCQELDFDFYSLFILKSKKDILAIVERCIELDKKTNKIKQAYYERLKETISNFKV